jgi:hypothetical protein
VKLQQPTPERNLYEVLKVPSDASEAEIQQAADQLTALYETQVTTEPQARQWLEEVQEAYKILSSPYRRNAYDISLEEQKLATQLKAEEAKKLDWEHLKKISQQTFASLLKTDEEKDRERAAPKATTAPPLQNIWQQAKTKWQQWQAREQSPDTTVPTPAASFPFPASLEQRKDDGLLSQEQLLKRAYIHPLFMLDFWGLLLTLGAGYLLHTDPYQFHETSAKINLTFPQSISQWLPTDLVSYLADVSIWSLGIWLLFGIGALILIDVLFAQISTSLRITTHRIILRHGVFWRREVELKLPQLDGISLNRSLLGRLLHYGDFTVTGVGGTKLFVPHLIGPTKIRRLLWELLAQSAQQTDSRQTPGTPD